MVSPDRFKYIYEESIKLLHNVVGIMQDLIPKNYKSDYLTEYHIFGTDILFSSDKKAYLLEINHNPDII